jgi:hypothetical protein
LAARRRFGGDYVPRWLVLRRALSWEGAEGDPAVKAGAVTFAGRLMSTYSAGMLCHLIDLGARTGQFDAAALGPATSAELVGPA